MLALQSMLASLLVASCTALRPELSMGRRGVLSAATTTLTATAQPAEQDLAAKSSFFGLAAPPIQASWSYKELLQEARAGAIATVQIAVQHDCVIAVTTTGHRYSCLLPDSDFPALLADAMLADGSMPFDVLPMDPARARVRDAASITLGLLGILWLADLADLLPWDTTPYASLAEREKGQTGKGPPLNPLARWLHAFTRSKPTVTQNQKARGGCVEDERHWGGGVTHEEALKRVLGLTTWDAAEELKERLRPRQLEQSLLDARPRQIEAHLLREVRQAREAATNAREVARAAAVKFQASVDELERRLREVPWVTPSAIDRSELPPLEALFTDTRRIHVEDGVAQYLRAHPSVDAPLPAQQATESHPAAEAFAKVTHMSIGGRWPLETAGAEEGGEEEEEGMVGDVCRLCPDFSAIYNHNVYICKRLVSSPA